MRKEFSTAYYGTTDVKTVLTDFSHPFGWSHVGRIRNITPYQLMTTYFKSALRRSTITTLYIGLVDVVPLLKFVDCRWSTIVLPDEDNRRHTPCSVTRMTKVS